MKKIISLVLVLAFVLVGFVACNKTTDEGNNGTTTAVTATEKSYTLALAVDTAISGTKVSNNVMALVIDADNKIVAARIDCVEATPELDEAGALVAQASVTTKVELGAAYSGMKAGSWADQAKAFETWLVGKSAADVAGAEITGTLVAGCTMTSSMATFKALVAEAFATANKVEFKTSDPVTAGLALNTTVSASRSGGATVSTDVAVVAIAGSKVAATVLDSIEQSFSITEGALVAGEVSLSKAEQGDAYSMPKGTWINQAKAFSASTVGKTVAELNDLEVVSDALAAAGCTMQNTTAGYKTTIIKAAASAK